MTKPLPCASRRPKSRAYVSHHCGREAQHGKCHARHMRSRCHNIGLEEGGATEQRPKRTCIAKRSYLMHLRDHICRGCTTACQYGKRERLPHPAVSRRKSGKVVLSYSGKNRGVESLRCAYRKSKRHLCQILLEELQQAVWMIFARVMGEEERSRRRALSRVASSCWRRIASRRPGRAWLEYKFSMMTIIFFSALIRTVGCLVLAKPGLSRSHCYIEKVHRQELARHLASAVMPLGGKAEATPHHGYLTMWFGRRSAMGMNGPATQSSLCSSGEVCWDDDKDRAGEMSSPWRSGQSHCS
jgi:hypothetical protein